MSADDHTDAIVLNYGKGYTGKEGNHGRPCSISRVTGLRDDGKLVMDQVEPAFVERAKFSSSRTMVAMTWYLPAWSLRAVRALRAPVHRRVPAGGQDRAIEGDARARNGLRPRPRRGAGRGERAALIQGGPVRRVVDYDTGQAAVPVESRYEDRFGGGGMRVSGARASRIAQMSQAEARAECARVIAEAQP